MSIELRKNALEEVSGIVEYISVFLKWKSKSDN